jgi:GNAT superfamily N-acetyltransferase
VFPSDKEIVGKLFLAYAESLPISLDFQNFTHEFASLPGKYAVENGGALYLAYTETPAAHGQPATEQVVGCVGLRAFSAPKSCELKRLYLTPDSRGLGVSKLLMDVVIAKARELRYKEMLLDTLSSMASARKLYEKYGFVEVDAYYESVPDAVFYRLDF